MDGRSRDYQATWKKTSGKGLYPTRACIYSSAGGTKPIATWMLEITYDPSTFLARLKEMIALKGLDPKAVHDRTGIPYDQLDRLGTGPRGTSASKLKALVVGLELDPNFLLDTEEKYRAMTPVQRASHMALDRYLSEKEHAKKPIDDAHIDELRQVAWLSTSPPLWSRDWEVHSERLLVSASARRATTQSAVPTTLGRRRVRRGAPS